MADQNWLYWGTDEAWLYYDYKSKTEKPVNVPTEVQPIEPVTAPENATLKERLALLNKALANPALIKQVRKSMGIKSYDTIEDLKENILTQDELVQWYSDGKHNVEDCILVLERLLTSFKWGWIEHNEKYEMYVGDLVELRGKISQDPNNPVTRFFIYHVQSLIELLQPQTEIISEVTVGQYTYYWYNEEKVKIVNNESPDLEYWTLFMYLEPRVEQKMLENCTIEF